jgi:hypothetical protein
MCCGKDSVFEDVPLSDPRSLEELSAKLQGTHRASDGRSIEINADYLSQSSINAATIVGALANQHAPLIEWKSRLYVLYGAIFDETLAYSGVREYSIHKLLLLDPRFSDVRRESVFNRDSDKLEDVQGVLILTIKSK